MLLLLFHDKSTLSEIAALKAAIEECYGTYGLLAQDGGYLFVPIRESRLNAARLLKHLGQIVSINATASDSYSASTNANDSIKAALWLVDSELFYPDIGAVFGCSTDRVALLSAADMERNVLVKEALHEVGHLLGLDHCQKRCIMRLSGTREEAEKKPPRLCPDCSARLMETPADRNRARQK
jgi:predicted Zn-dependent protease